MATVHYRDRVKDTTTTSGTDPIYLNNTPLTGYKSFYSGFYETVGRDPGTPPVLVGYCMVNEANGEWEMGVGSYDGDRTITRNAIGYAIKANSINVPAQPVNFAAGTKTVFCTPYSAGLTFLDDSQVFSSDSLRLGSFANGMVITNGTGGVLATSAVTIDSPDGVIITETTLNVPGVLKSNTNSLTIRPRTINQPYIQGTLTLTTSNATTGGSGALSRAGGPLSITTGIGYLTGAGGKITIKPGVGGAAGATTANGAIVSISAGDTNTTGAGLGGLLTLNGGNTSGTGTGGKVQISGGVGAIGGPVVIVGANGNTSAGGTISLTGGTGTVGGGVSLTGGQSTLAGLGAIVLADGATVVGGGGTASITAGDADFGANAPGGSISITAGGGGAGGALCHGGDVTIRGGLPGSITGNNGGSVKISVRNGQTGGLNGLFRISTENIVDVFTVGEGNAGNPLMGFFGTGATDRPSITGSRGGNVALANLLTALQTLGLVINNTTA